MIKKADNLYMEAERKGIRIIFDDGRPASKSDFLYNVLIRGKQEFPLDVAEKIWRIDDPKYDDSGATYEIKNRDGKRIGTVSAYIVKYPFRDDGLDYTEFWFPFSIVATLFFLLLTSGILVYFDARVVNMHRPFLWGLVSLISFPIGLLIYLIVRPGAPKIVSCHHCGKKVKETFAICPYCGAELLYSKPRCPKCEREVEKDWIFCPYCQTMLQKATEKQEV